MPQSALPVRSSPSPEIAIAPLPPRRTDRPRRRRSNSSAANAGDHLRPETKPCPPPSSDGRRRVRIPAGTTDGMDGLLGNVDSQRCYAAHLNARTNGRHERMHLTLKKEATKPASKNFLQQQARFDKFIEVFNNERPHEALEMKCPAEVYQPSPRPYTGLPDIDYPLHDKTIVVTPHLSGQEKNQFQPGLCRTGRRHQGSARRHLACKFYGL